jgi:hypothetical protein
MLAADEVQDLFHGAAKVEGPSRRLRCAAYHRAMLKKLLIGVLAFPWAAAADAQDPKGSVRGTVRDEAGNTLLPLAAVQLFPGEDRLGATTDSLGRYFIGEVPVGLYRLQASMLGYEALMVPEVWVRAGKETVLDLVLAHSVTSLQAVTVSAMGREEAAPFGVRTITVEQGLRYPAMFFDPARIATAGPGVAAANDQANHLVVRGNSPNANAWLLEGAEIVNPCHLGNAGTANDRPTLSGGGVNILSAQMLGPSRFRTGAGSAAYGNATGGLMDMELRKGSTQHREWTLQAGLIGIDMSTEGPIGRDGRSFHLVNARWSTLGLLSAMGVGLGDEAIGFQDLSFHAGTALGKRGELRVFGLGGRSSNVHAALRDTADWRYDKDSKDIGYASSMGALGAACAMPLGRDAVLRATVAWSAAYQEREETDHDTRFEEIAHAFSSMYERKATAVVRVEGTLSARLRYLVGGSAMQRAVANLFGQDAATTLLRPFAQVRYDLTERLQATVGLAYSRYSATRADLPEPRAALRLRLPRGSELSAALGVRGQWPQAQQVNLARYPGWPSSADLDPVRSVDAALAYRYPLGERWTVHAELYRQRLSGVPALAPGIALEPPLPVTSVNLWDEAQALPQRSIGTAMNEGVELGAERRFDRGWYAQANAALFSSTWRDAGGVDRSSRWDARWMAQGMAGREFSRTRSDAGKRTWGIGLRASAMGGQRYTAMLVAATPAGDRWEAVGDPYAARLKDFFRMDLRVYLKRDRAGRTGLWALDLQNATAARNEAYHYFDRRQGTLVAAYQLGFIPNLSYRIEF